MASESGLIFANVWPAFDNCPHNFAGRNLGGPKMIPELLMIASGQSLFLFARVEWAYCWQDARFAGDVEFWSRRISRPETVKAVKNGKGLSFVLSDQSDFAAFYAAAAQELLTASWSQELAVPEFGEETTDAMAATAGSE